MDNKIQNIVLKSLMGLIIFLGTLFTIWVVMSGDPGNMSDVELEQLAIKEVKTNSIADLITSNVILLDSFKLANRKYEGKDSLAIIADLDTLKLDNFLVQQDLTTWIYSRGKKIKNEKQEITYNAVSLVIDFTTWVFYLTIILVVASVGYLFTVDAKKAAINMAGILGVIGFILIIFYTAGSDVPQEYVAAETLKGVADEDRSFTEGNWQFASAALTSTVVLTVIALLGWIGGTVMKVFK